MTIKNHRVVDKSAKLLGLEEVNRIQVTGAQVKEALEHGVSRYPADVGIFPQVSGISFTLDSSAQAGKRVVSVEVNGKPLDLMQKYSLTVTNFMHMGGDGYSMLVNAPLLGEYGLADDVLAAYNYKWSDRPSGTTKEQGQDYTRLLSTGQNDSHHTYFAELPYIQLSPFANYPPTLLFPEQTFP